MKCLHADKFKGVMFAKNGCACCAYEEAIRKRDSELMRLRAFAKECANDHLDRVSGGIKEMARDALADPMGRV